MYQFVDYLATTDGQSLPCFPVDHQQSGCMMYMSVLDPKSRFRDPLEQMVCHGTPVYIIESCPLPPHTSNSLSMAKTLNVTFEPHMSVQAYYHVPNRDIHCPEPWMPGKIGFRK